MKYIALLILSILTGCSKNYNSEISQKLEEKFGSKFEFDIIDAKQSTSTRLERKLMLHSVFVEFEAKDDYYQTTRNTLANLLPEDFKNERAKFINNRPFLHFRHTVKHPDLNSAFSKYLIYEKIISEGDSFKVKLEIASLLYDDESIELDKNFRVKEIKTDKFSNFPLNNSELLTSKNDFKANYLLKDSPEINNKLKELIAENKLQMAQYTQAIEDAKKQKEQKDLAEEMNREQERQVKIAERTKKEEIFKEQKRKVKDAEEKEIARIHQGKLNYFLSKTATGTKYSGYFYNSEGYKEVDFEFLENMDNGNAIKVKLTFKKHPKYYVLYKGHLSDYNNDNLFYMNLFVEEAAIPKKSDDKWIKDFIYPTAKFHKSVISIEGPKDSLISGIYQNSRSYSKRSTYLKLTRVKYE